MIAEPQTSLRGEPDWHDAQGPATSLKRRRRFAWILILIVDVGLVAWGAMAAVLQDQLPGPAGTPILIAGYEGFSNASWSDLMDRSPMTAAYIRLLFRTYGAFNVAFGLMASAIAVTSFRRGERWAWWALLVGNTIALVAAMAYDRTVNAIGPFELSEYLGLAFVWGGLAITAPSLARNAQPDRRREMP